MGGIQGLQAVDVTKNGFRLVKQPGQIFPGSKVYRGFPPYRGIHGGKQGGGYLDKRHPAQITAGSKTGEIARDTATQSDEAILSCQSVFSQKLQKIGQNAEVFGAFSRREDLRDHGKTGRPQAAFKHRQIQGGNIAVGEHRHPTGAPQ